MNEPLSQFGFKSERNLPSEKVDVDGLVTVKPEEVYSVQVLDYLKNNGKVLSSVRVLPGYRNPQFSKSNGGGYEEFQSWIEKTAKRADPKIIGQTIQLLELQLAYFDYLPQEEIFSRESREIGRLEEGKGTLSMCLEALVN